MDRSRGSISPDSLYSRLGTASAPIVIDVRREPAFEAADAMIVGALRHRPEEVDRWRTALPQGRPVVVYCVHGHEVSQQAAAALGAAGIDAKFLDGGIA